ncbi:hypothetical protein [Mycolicibacterium vulneris]|jgi:hypothetical protein|uniref:hypothetical protein n=1 Tax=Mycolicibacterium vulneris TaxID=547163 RepID=UPI003F6DE0A5
MTEQPQKISLKKAHARCQCCVDGFFEFGSTKRNDLARAMLNQPKSSGNIRLVSSPLVARGRVKEAFEQRDCRWMAHPSTPDQLVKRRAASR